MCVCVHVWYFKTFVFVLSIVIFCLTDSLRLVKFPTVVFACFPFTWHLIQDDFFFNISISGNNFLSVFLKIHITHAVAVLLFFFFFFSSSFLFIYFSLLSINPAKIFVEFFFRSFLILHIFTNFFFFLNTTAFFLESYIVYSIHTLQMFCCFHDFLIFILRNTDLSSQALFLGMWV